MCVYIDCLYPCFDKKEHHARYANMRRNKYSEKKNEVKTKSSKVNWNVVNDLNIEDKTVIINRMKDKIKNKYIHDHDILKD